MVRISVLEHKIRGEKHNKKRFSARNLRLRLGVHSCMLSWKDTLLTLGEGTSSILGVTGPKMYSSGTGPLFFFWGKILAWGAHFSLGGTSSDLGGYGPKMPSRGDGLLRYIVLESTFVFYSS